MKIFQKERLKNYFFKTAFENRPTNLAETKIPNRTDSRNVESPEPSKNPPVRPQTSETKQLRNIPLENPYEPPPRPPIILRIVKTLDETSYVTQSTSQNFQLA